MNWIAIAIVAYFLISLEVILDKFLLSSKRISHPAIYTFYSGMLSFLAIVLFPFGLHGISFLQFFQYLSVGFVFSYGVLMLFSAIKKNEASRVTPAIGAIIPIATFFLSVIFLKDYLSAKQVLGVLLLIFGGLLISWEFSFGRKKERHFYDGFRETVLAGILLAVSYIFFKSLCEQDNFINVFIWSRMGFTLGALSLLFFIPWRKAIFGSLVRFKKPEKENKRSGFLFSANKLLGGIGSILLNFSISLGDVTIVNAMVALEYVFIFLMGLFFSLQFPKIFQEKTNWKNIAQKLSAIFIITAGLILVSVVR